MICGGGTGGHLYPALALSDALLRSGQNVKILFAGPEKNKEQVMTYNSALDFYSVPAAPLTGTPLALVKNASVLCSGFFHARRMLSREKPRAVAGMGAYSSVPVALAASVLKIPVFLHEQNVVPGKATLFLSRFAEKIFLSFDSSLPYFESQKEKISVCGNPVRTLPATAGKREIFPPLGFSENKKTVLVFGGSHGAKRLNDAVAGMLDFISSQDDFQLIHISGQFDFERVNTISTSIKNLKNYHVFAYREDLLDYMAAGDLVVCRAGATTCAELLALGKPSVLVPYPHATNQHQLKNAEELERAGAAQILRDERVDAGSLQKLLLEILMDDVRLSRMADACRKHAKPDAGVTMADDVLKSLVDKTS